MVCQEERERREGMRKGRGERGFKQSGKEKGHSSNFQPSSFSFMSRATAANTIRKNTLLPENRRER